MLLFGTYKYLFKDLFFVRCQVAKNNVRYCTRSEADQQQTSQGWFFGGTNICIVSERDKVNELTHENKVFNTHSKMLITKINLTAYFV